MIQDTSGQDRALVRTGLWKKRVLWSAILLVPITVVAWITTPHLNRWSKADRSVQRRQLTLAEVSIGNLVRDIAVEGRIVASSYPTIFSPAEGSVDLVVRAGERVTKDQLLARIKSPRLENQLKQENATAEALSAELSRQRIQAKNTRLLNRQDIDLKKLRLDSANRAYDRAKKTFDQGLIDAAAYEKAEDDARIAELDYRHALASSDLEDETLTFEIRNRELQLERQNLVVQDTLRQVDELAIKSPVNGVIGSVSIDPSDFVNTNQALMTVIDLSAFEIEISIPEVYGDEIDPGVVAEITYEGAQYPGLVTATSPEVNNSLVRGRVVFSGSPPRGLKQNQRVNTRIILASKSSVLKVRRGPFLEAEGGRFAYLVRDGLAVRSPIQTGAVSLTEVEILQGLAAGDTIVISDTNQFEQAATILLTN